MIITSIIIMISLMILAISYMLVLSLRQINQYEEFIIRISQIVEFTTLKMKQVDASGHYESDDETGFFFEQLKELQLNLNNIFEPLPTQEKYIAKEEKQKTDVL